MNKIYLVMNVEDEGDSMIEKAFSTREKAEQYKLELENDFKDEIRFQHKFWYYEIEELEIN
jgi:hypothetical protein